MNWFHYLIQVNLYLVLFYGFYILMLRNETFFRMNRIYLISGGMLSFLIPLIQSEWVQSLFITEQIRQTTQTLNIIVLRPVLEQQQIKTGLSTIQILMIIYLAGTGIFLGRFIWQLSKIKQALKPYKTGQAFSFLNKVSVDSSLQARDTILRHEQVHVRQWHSADVLFFEMVAAINWCNPVVYAYKKSIKSIHEFISDEIASQQETNKTEYALLLMSNTFGIQALPLGNQFFNQSLLKRRIFMLSKTKSKKIAILKYGLSVPLFAVMLIFSAAVIKKTEAAIIISKIAPAMNLIAPEQAGSEEQILKKPVSGVKIINEETTKKENMSSADTDKNSIQIQAIQQPGTNDRVAVVTQEDKPVSMETVNVLPAFNGNWGEFVSRNYYSPKQCLKVASVVQYI